MGRSLLSLVASNSIKLVDNRSPESLRAFEILSVWLQHVEILWEGFADSTLSHNFSFSNSDPESDNSDSSDSDFEPEKEVTGNDTWLQWFHFLSVLAFFFFLPVCVCLSFGCKSMGVILVQCLVEVWRQLFNPLTPKIWLLILPSSCYRFPCNLVTRILCYIMITTSNW